MKRYCYYLIVFILIFLCGCSSNVSDNTSSAEISAVDSVSRLEDLNFDDSQDSDASLIDEVRADELTDDADGAVNAGTDSSVDESLSDPASEIPLDDNDNSGSVALEDNNSNTVVEINLEALQNESLIVTEATEAAIPDIFEPVASGELVEQNSKACIDYSHTEDGYVMVKFTAQTSKRLKVQVIGPTTKYTYNISVGEWEVLPLTDGNGNYLIKVFENVRDNQYSLVLGFETYVSLTDEFAPFLRPNQYVDYNASSSIVKKASELSAGIDDPLKKVEAIYDYVINNLSYDKQKAATVKSGYIPDLDDVMSCKSGICFDYAALMTGMLRSQGIPCKMIFGYAGTVYHAWISVWTEDSGWVDGVIFFDGTTWQRVDPTFASSGNQSESIMEYIGNGNNYTDKYMY